MVDVDIRAHTVYLQHKVQSNKKTHARRSKKKLGGRQEKQTWSPTNHATPRMLARYKKTKLRKSPAERQETKKQEESARRGKHNSPPG